MYLYETYLLSSPAVEKNGTVPTSLFLHKSLDLIVSIKEFLHWPFRPGSLACWGNFISCLISFLWKLHVALSYFSHFGPGFKAHDRNLWFVIHSLLFGILYVCLYCRYGNKLLPLWFFKLVFVGFRGRNMELKCLYSVIFKWMTGILTWAYDLGIESNTRKQILVH